jgi:hypothetical protein
MTPRAIPAAILSEDSPIVATDDPEEVFSCSTSNPMLNGPLVTPNRDIVALREHLPWDKLSKDRSDKQVMDEFPNEVKTQAVDPWQDALAAISVTFESSVASRGRLDPTMFKDTPDVCDNTTGGDLWLATGKAFMVSWMSHADAAVDLLAGTPARRISSTYM